MPQRAPRPCLHPGCSALVVDGKCPRHSQRTMENSRDVQRGTFTQRGYGYRWTKYRNWFIKQDQCQECGRNHTLCEGECRAQGRIVPAYAVDHIVPHRGNQKLFWDHNNLQSLCAYEHGVKSAREQLHNIDS